MTPTADLRRLEARRMLGLITGDEIDGLPARADGWLAAGLASPSLELLAASGSDDDGDSSVADRRLRLLRAAAVELGLTFATTQEARGHHIEANLISLTTAEGAAQIPALSNGLTDELTARLARRVRRLLGRHG